MNNNIIDQGAPNDGGTVDLGSGQIVSMKAVQQMYADITGRTETLERSYKNNHSIGFDDLCQLDAKISQLQEQYNIVSKNCSVTLFHLDDQKQTFSSFERFKLFDRTTLSPVENVRLEYNYLIVLPQMRKPQSYEIEINIHSRAAQIKRANGDTSARNMMFYEFFSPYTGHVEIEHVDYTVARNFQSAIDGWFKSLHEIETGWLLTPLKKLSGYYIFAFRTILVSAYLVGCYQYFMAAFNGAPPGQAAVFAAAVVTFGGMFLMSIVSGKLGSVAAESIKRVQCKSYVNLTRGDELAFKQMSASNRLAWLKTVGSVVLALAVKVLSEYIVIKIGIKP